MIAVLTENRQTRSRFTITSTLGDLESASPQLLYRRDHQQTMQRPAPRVLHTHRNTLLRRLETAQRLLPRPSTTIIQVAVAISAPQWRGSRTSDPVRAPVRSY